MPQLIPQEDDPIDAYAWMQHHRIGESRRTPIGAETSEWLREISGPPETRPENFRELLDVECSRPIIGFIATKNPTLALVGTVTSLLNGGASSVLVIDDGNGPECQEIFRLAEEAGATVMHMPENVGKSSALRAGFISLPDDPSIIIAQTDDDTLAGDLRIPAKMIENGKADIVDIRVETFDGHNLIGLAQQLDYWVINAVIKRFQNWLRARLWLSGASVMYTYDAARVLLLPEAQTRTEDTEGRYRAIGAGLRLRFCSSPKAQFKTMVPESLPELHKQWKRWALGNAQILRMYGFGGGSRWVATVNVLSWADMIISPVAQFLTGNLFRNFMPATVSVPEATVIGPVGSDILAGVLWMGIFGVLLGIVGAVRMKRPALLVAGVFIPILSLWWTYVAIQALAISHKQRDAKGSLSWDPPKRMAMSESDVSALEAMSMEIQP